MLPAQPLSSLSRRATGWRLRTRELCFGVRPLVMGIVNVTPDSFSDGGKFLAPERALAHARQLVREGADILDIGGESTRPYSDPVALDEEIQRVIPVIHQLCQETQIPVSIDTSKAEVARVALAEGAEIINDITGFEADPQMMTVARDLQAGVCAMHMQGTPRTMQEDPQYADVVAEILDYLRQRRDALLGAGIDRERICLDPGIGFGKTHQHNLTLIAHCHRFHELGHPLLVGHSRKGFIAKVMGDKERDRTAGSLATSLTLALRGIQILRVHDVQATRDALELFEATGGLTGHAGQLP